LIFSSLFSSFFTNYIRSDYSFQIFDLKVFPYTNSYQKLSYRNKLHTETQFAPFSTNKQKTVEINSFSKKQIDKLLKTHLVGRLELSKNSLGVAWFPTEEQQSPSPFIHLCTKSKSKKHPNERNSFFQFI